MSASNKRSWESEHKKANEYRTIYILIYLTDVIFYNINYCNVEIKSKARFLQDLPFSTV